MFTKTLIAWTGFGLLALSPVAAELSSHRQIGDLRVNDVVSSSQERPSVAAFDGGWVAAWQSREGVNDLEIRARLTSTQNGTVNDILVNDSSDGTQSWPDVAVDADGNFAVVWYSNEPVGVGGDDSGFGVAARLFSADGTPLGPSFQVNDLTNGHQMHPKVAMHADGSFVVAWRSQSSLGTDNSGASIQARLFAADGTPLGAGFQVNVHTTFNQHYPDVAVAPNGTFTIAWQSLLQDGSIDGVYLRRFANDGTPLAGERQVNVQTAGSQSFPSLATASNGSTLVVWQSEHNEHNLEVRGRLFGSNGQAIGTELELNTIQDGEQILPAVAAIQGGFLVAWQSEQTGGSDTEGYSIQVRVFNLGGQAMEAEMQLNLSTENNQQNVAVGGDGPDIAVVWDSDHEPGTDEDVFIFVNGRTVAHSAKAR